jgi:hypothetical protein
VPSRFWVGFQVAASQAGSCALPSLLMSCSELLCLRLTSSRFVPRGKSLFLVCSLPAARPPEGLLQCLAGCRWRQTLPRVWQGGGDRALSLSHQERGWVGALASPLLSQPLEQGFPSPLLGITSWSPLHRPVGLGWAPLRRRMFAVCAFARLAQGAVPSPIASTGFTLIACTTG